MTGLRHGWVALALFGLGACAAHKEAPVESPKAPHKEAPVESPKTPTESSAPVAPGASSTPAQPGDGSLQSDGEPGGLSTGEPSGEPSAVPQSASRPALDQKSKDKADQVEFTSVAEAEAALDQAKRELVSLTAGAKKQRSGGAPAKAAARPMSDGDVRCESACKAFASLERAAKGVCRLTREDDARCVRAKTIVDEHRARVAACKCSQNGG